MNAYKNCLATLTLFFSFFINYTMQFTNFEGNILLNILWHIKPLHNEILSDTYNELKYFCKSILYFSFINKKMNNLAKEFLENKNNSDLEYMMTLHKEKKLHLFTYLCLKNNTEYHCIGELHFFPKKIRDLGSKYNYWEGKHSYALIISIHRHDTCVKIDTMLTKLWRDWNCKTLDSELFKLCIDYAHDKSIKKEINEWQNIFNDHISLPRGGNTETKNLETHNLYTFERYFALIENCTYKLFSDFLTLKHAETAKI